MLKLQEIWRNLEPRGQVGIVGAVIAVLATMFLLYSYSSKPTYVTLENNLAPADAGPATKALGSAGIPYKLGDGGTSIEVPDKQLAQARITLAEKNLLGTNAHQGWSIMDHSSLGITQTEQDIAILRARQGEIAMAIEQIQGVNSADVQLVTPAQTLFADEKSQASAMVVLNTSQQLDSTAISGIANLVKSDVEGLQLQNVTIADQSGTQLWPTSTAGGVTPDVKLQAEQSYSNEVGARINALLLSTLGAGKAVASVHSDLNVDQTTIDKVTYAKKGTPLQTQTGSELLKNKGGGATAGAAAGAASNIPTYPAGAAATGAGSSSNYSNRTGTTTFGVDKTVEHTAVVPGQVQRLDVALLVDRSVPKKQVTALKSAVASVAGIDPKRGDILAVSTVSFAKQPKAVAPPAAAAGPLANPLGLAKYVLLGLGAVIFLFLMRRGLKRREGEDLGVKPTWLREIETTVPLSELEAGPSRALEAGGDRRVQQQAELEEIVQAQPQRVAAQVGQWMKD